MPEPDPYAHWSLSDRLQLLAFEAELAHLPRPLIAALWEAIDILGPRSNLPHSLYLSSYIPPRLGDHQRASAEVNLGTRLLARGRLAFMQSFSRRFERFRGRQPLRHLAPLHLLSGLR